MLSLARHRSLRSAIATTIGLWLVLAAVFVRDLVALIMGTVGIAALLGVSALAAAVARLPFARPVARGHAAGVAVAVVCVALAATCGNVWGYAPEVLLLAAVPIAVALYTDDAERASPTTMRITAPSAIAVASIGGCVALYGVFANSWMTESTLGPVVALQSFARLLLLTVLLPLGWSHALCHVAARRWPAFLAPGRHALLVRALPGALLVLVPVLVLALTRIGHALPPKLVLWSGYAAALIVMLRARSQRNTTASGAGSPDDCVRHEGA